MRQGPVMALVAAGILLAGCATERQIVQGKEDMLAAAGFTIRPADTPERQAQLKTLTPHRFIYQQRNGTNVYIYSDPTICDCLYIGTEQAYQKYRQLAIQKQIADEQVQAAQMNSMANMNNFSWGAWGPGF